MREQERPAEGFVHGTVRSVAVTTSTQDVVRRAAVAGAAEGFCCIADSQTGGRGRQGRTWAAPPGTALLASVLVRRPAGVVSAVPFAAGLALIEALDAHAVPGLALKWPNDLVARGRKLAGILCELEPAASDGQRAAVVVGAGVNLRVTQFPPGAEGISVHELAPPPEPGRLLESWLGRLAARVDHLERSGPAPLLEAWTGRATGIDGAVRADTPSGTVTGTARGLAEDGALLIETEDGEMRRLVAGDVHIGSRPR